MGRITALFLLPLLACGPISADQPVERPAAVADCAPSLAAFRKAGNEWDGVTVQRAADAIAERPECFENERVPVPQLRSVVETAARQTVRDFLAERDGRSAGTTDGQAACERYAALVANQKLGVGSDAVRDLADLVCAYADAASGTAAGYLSALTQVESLRGEELRNETRKDLVQRVYLRHYFLGGLGTNSAGLRESYPLSGVADPYAFVSDVLLPRLYQSPIPASVFDEQGFDDRVRHDLVYMHFMREADRSGNWATVGSMAEAYVKHGYDPAFTYRVAYDCVMNAEADFSLAIRLASHLGSAEKRAAVEGRIAQLDASADFDVLVGPDGRRSYLYHMRDDPASE